MVYTIFFLETFTFGGLQLVVMASDQQQNNNFSENNVFKQVINHNFIHDLQPIINFQSGVS